MFKVFIEDVTIFLLFSVLVFGPRGMWDLSPPTRDQTCDSCTGRRVLYTGATWEAPQYKHFPGGSDGNASAYNVGDLGSTPGSGRSGEGNGNPLQCFCLENPMDGGTW